MGERILVPMDDSGRAGRSATRWRSSRTPRSRPSTSSGRRRWRTTVSLALEDEFETAAEGTTRGYQSSV